MPTVTSIAFILGGGILCLLVVRLVGGSRSLLVILLPSYSLRVALTLGLYLVSAYELPIFRSLQLPGGFWRFTYDAPSYHANGARIAEALRLGIEIPQVTVGDQPFLVGNYDFSYFVGLVYWALGAHPLYVPFLNAMFWTAIAVLGYTLAHRIRGEDAGRFAALLISFWPSTFVWSSQILKDSLVVFLLLFSLYLVVRIWEERRWVALPAAVVLVPAVFLLTRVRFYLVALLILAVVLSVGLTLAVRFREFRWGSVVRALTLIILLWVPFFSARFVDPLYFLFSTRSESVAAGPSVATSPSSVAAGPSVATSPSKVKPETSQGPKTRQLQSFLEAMVKDVQKSAAEAVEKNVDLVRQTYNVGNVDTRRRGYASTGGASNVAAEVQFRNHWDMVAFLPRGLMYALYSPFPWEWFSPGGDTGVFKAFSGIETLLMVAVTPFLLVGILRAVRSKHMGAWTLLIFGAIMIVSLALTVTNLGILFRFRLQGLIPLFILVSAFGISAGRVRRILARWVSRP